MITPRRDHALQLAMWACMSNCDRHTVSQAQWMDHPLLRWRIQMFKMVLGRPLLSSGPEQRPAPAWAGPGWDDRCLPNPPERPTTTTTTTPVTWAWSHDPRQPEQPIVLLSPCPHAVGKHSNRWPWTAPETSATSATGASPPPCCFRA